MFHFGLSRSIRSGLFHIQCARRNLASLKDSFPCKHNFRCKGVFLKVYCSHSTAHKRESIMAAQMGDFIKSTRWINKTTIKLGTFNLLAPCYKTTEARTWKTWWGGTKESSHPEQFLSRYEETFRILDALPKYDFMCLQEFWFDNGIAELFEQRIGERYFIIKHKRPTRHDGVALLIDRKYEIRHVEYIKFNDIGMRVALLANVINLETDQEAIIATTHLTYLANYLDQFTRMIQAKKLVQAIDAFLLRQERTDIPLFLAGDFNGCPNGPIYNFFLQNGFKSSYQDFHGREPVVTHLDHNCSPLAVDYIFYRMPAELECNVKEAFLFPKDRSDMEWPSDFIASDHRLVFAELSVGTKQSKY